MNKNLEIINIGMSFIDNELYGDFLNLLQKLFSLRRQGSANALTDVKINKETTDAILISLGIYSLTHVGHKEQFLSGLIETWAYASLNTPEENRVLLLLEWLAESEFFYSDAKLCAALCKRETQYLTPSKIKSALFDFMAIILSNLEEISEIDEGDDHNMQDYFQELAFPFMQNLFKIAQMEKALKLLRRSLSNVQVQDMDNGMTPFLTNSFHKSAVNFIINLEDELHNQKSRLQSYVVQKENLSQNRYNLLQENICNAFLHSAFMKNTMLYALNSQVYEAQFDAIDFTEEAPRILNWGQFVGLDVGHKYNIAALGNVISNFAEKENFDRFLGKCQTLDTSLDYVGILDIETETDMYLSKLINYGRIPYFIEFPIQPRVSLKIQQRRIPLFVLSMDKTFSGLVLFQLKKNWKEILASRPDLKTSSLSFPRFDELSPIEGEVKFKFNAVSQNEYISDRAFWFSNVKK